MANHELYMHRCLQLAAHGAGFVAPNPLVGAVLVYKDRIIGEGWHERYGEAHAEINCIDSVSDADKPFICESIMYVSLEPCAHVGKTPPCANRIVAEGIPHVVIGSLDPFPEVAGRGVTILQRSGVKTDIGVLEADCRFQNRRFFTFHEYKRPYIHLKWAQTADGFMSGKNGDRLQITNPFTNRLVHKWRSEEAAIMVGTKTAAVDNPQLNNRLWTGAQPVRVVVDALQTLSGELKLFTDGGRTIVLNGGEYVETDAGVLGVSRCVETRTGAADAGALGVSRCEKTRTEATNDEGCVETTRTKAAVEPRAEVVQRVKVEGLSSHDPKIICDAMYSLNIQSVLIEGGAALLNSFLEAGLWDEAHILTNTALFESGGVKAPGKPYGFLKESFLNGKDLIEWVIKK